MKRIYVLIGILVLSSVFSGCQKANNPAEAGSLKKLRVEVYDRNNAPEGAGSATDNRYTRWIREEVKSLGIDLEFVACPRNQEVQKLNVWMAANNAPDIVFNGIQLMQKYAEQGGLHELSKYVDENGYAIKEKMGDLLQYGMYKGKLYAVSGKKEAAGPTMKIRKDWLDKLGMPVPETSDDLYKVLKAFKEQDPGGVGKENVVPWALPAPGVIGTQGFYADVMYSFGVRNDGPAFACLVGGNYDGGVYRSPVDLPEAREFYRFLNKLYKEDLIHKEFVVDNNGNRYAQHVASGVAGFVDSNDVDMNPLTKDSVPSAEWYIMEPLAAPDGERICGVAAPLRWCNMVPKQSSVPDLAVKYLNWMADKKIDTVLQYGFEGEHYDMKDGVIIVRDKQYNQKDIFNGNDLNLIGFINYEVPKEKRDLVYVTDSDKKKVRTYEICETYGVERPTIDVPAPVYQELNGTLSKFVFEGAAKVIVAENFDAEYDNYISEWKHLGGDKYDTELGEIIKGKRNQ